MSDGLVGDRTGTDALTISTDGLGYAYGDAPVLHDLTLPATSAGQVTALCGPNATGKSTLLKCLAGLITPTGTVRLERDGVAEHVPTGNRQVDDGLVLYMPQDLPASSSLSVFEAVLLARQQQRRTGMRRPRVGKEVTDDIERVLGSLGIEELALRPVSELSGGQRQLVSLAQAVVRRPPVLLLDEPTSNLDLRNQLHILDLVATIATTQPAAVLVTVHDLNLVARFADQVVVLHRGGVHSWGPPATVITEQMLREVYQVEGTVSRARDGSVSVVATRSL